MSLVWTESCQNMRDSAPATRRYFSAQGAYEAAAGRNGGPAFGMRVLAYPLNPAPQGNIFLCSIRSNYRGGAFEMLCGPGVDASTVSNSSSLPFLHCGLTISSVGALQVQRGATILATTASSFVTPGLHGFTVRFVIDATAGSAEVWMDGVHVTALDFNGNTKNLGGSANWNCFQAGNTLDVHQWCDLVVCDGVSPAPSSIAAILEARVDTLFPNGNGNYSQFTGSDSDNVNNYLLVDEDSPNDDVDYVEATVAAKDSYTVQDVPAGATIIGITTYAQARKTDAGLGALKTGVRVSGTDYMDDDSRALGVTYSDYTRCLGRNPATGLNWTEAAVNALEIVFERVGEVGGGDGGGGEEGGDDPLVVGAFFVALTGDDGGLGTELDPWATLTFALTQLTAGSTLYMRGGTYAEAILNNAPSGTDWDNKIRIVGYPGETVWLHPTDPDGRVIELGGGDDEHIYIEFDFINLDGTDSLETIKLYTGRVDGTGNAHHIRWKNAEILGPAHNTFRDDGPTGQTILWTAGDETSIGGNELLSVVIHGGLQNDFDHHVYCQSPDNLFNDIDVYDFPGSAFEFNNSNGLGAQASNNILRNSRIHDDRHNVAGQRHSAIVATWVGNQIYNNLIFNLKSDGATCIGISVYSSDATEVYNNTVYNIEGTGIRVDSTATNAVIKNNISYLCVDAAYDDEGTDTDESSNSFDGTDPQFVDAASGDFHLQATSPMRDAGETIALVDTDKDVVARPQGSAYDIGAYEYAA